MATTLVSRTHFPTGSTVQWTPTFTQGAVSAGEVVAQRYPGRPVGYLSVKSGWATYCVHVSRLSALHVHHTVSA